MNSYGAKVKVLNFQDVFLAQANAFLQKNRSDKTAVFFYGFGSEQNKAILALDGAVSIPGILYGDGALNIPALDEKKAEIAQSLLTGSGLRVGIYEQLLAALSAVPEFAECFGGKIVIVENNLFLKKYPSAIPEEAAKVLYSYFQEDSTVIPDKISVYLNYYDDVDSLDDKHYFTVPLLRDAGRNFSRLPFFPL